MVDYDKIPYFTMEAIKNYVESGYATDLIQAIMSNDLEGTVARADPENMANLAAIVTYVNCKLPGDCWGSPEKVRAWKAKGGQKGKA